MRKTLFIVAALLPAIYSCEPDFHSIDPYKTRAEALSGGSSSGGGGHSGTNPAIPVRDTTVWVSGIDFPDGYDWRQDSLYGGVAARVVLLRGQEQVLDLPAGAAQHVSAQADMHHLVDGHLYTEYSDESSTYIKRDGKDLYKFADAECLRSILPFGNDIYTLTQKRSGNGFVLRRGSEILMERDEGVVQGTFGEGAEPQYGALYINDGHICFSYTRRLGSQGSQMAFYIVVDGVEAQQYSDKGEIIAARQVGDDICLLTLNRTSGLLMLKVGKHEYVIQNQKVSSVKNVAISSLNGQIFMAATILFANGNGHTGIWIGGELQRAISGRSVVLRENDTVCYMSENNNGDLLLYNSNGLKTNEIRQHFLFSQNCGQLCGGKLFLATTSSADDHPVLWQDGKSEEIDIHGMLTGISVVVTDR